MNQDWKDGFAAGWKAAMEAMKEAVKGKPDPKSTPIAGGWL